MLTRITLLVSLVVAGWVGSAQTPSAKLGHGEVVRVEMRADEPTDQFEIRTRVIDDLGSRSVLEIRVSGFEGQTAVQAEQCVYGPTRSCSNRLPVQTDDAGRATFQYLVTESFSPAAADSGRCAPDRNRCTVRVTAISGDDEAELDTVFNGVARPVGQITVTPRSEIVDGSTVAVSVTGYPPGAEFDAVLCRGPDAPSARTCGSPGSATPMTIDDDGTGETTLELARGPVGTSATLCTRRTVCGVTLVSPDTYVRAATVPITFAGRAGPEYDITRLTTGLGVAALLLALALWLMVSGEWGPPQEADASALEDAVYADLDAMVAAQDAREMAASVSPAER